MAMYMDMHAKESTCITGNVYRCISMYTVYTALCHLVWVHLHVLYIIYTALPVGTLYRVQCLRVEWDCLGTGKVLIRSGSSQEEATLPNHPG